MALLNGGHELHERLGWRVPGECFARAVVEQVSNGVEAVLIEDRQISPLGQKLPQKAVGVLATSLLPRAVRIAEIHSDVCITSQLPVAVHLPSLIVGQALTKGGQQPD